MLIFLDRIDAVPLGDDDFSFEVNSWMSIIADTLNENFQDIETILNGEGLATQVSRKTTAEITAAISMNADPVLEVGAIWFDKTVGKLKVLVTAAVSGVSNGVTETITSV